MKVRVCVISYLFLYLAHCVNFAISKDADGGGDLENLSFALRVELFSFANGNRFLTTQHVNSSNTSSVSDDDRVIALTVTTMLQRLPIMVIANKTMGDAASQTIKQCPPGKGCNISEALMRTYLQVLGSVFETDVHLSEAFLITKAAFKLVVKQLRVGPRVPYDPEKDNLSKVLNEWSKDKDIRSLLVGDVLLNSCLQSGEAAIFAKALIFLSRDSTDSDARTESFYSEAVKRAVDVSLQANNSENDFAHPNFFWYNNAANKTLIDILNSQLHEDGSIGARFDKIRETLRETFEYGFRIQSLLLLVGLTIVSTIIIVLLWKTGRCIYRKYRSNYDEQVDDDSIVVELPDD